MIRTGFVEFMSSYSYIKQCGCLELHYIYIVFCRGEGREDVLVLDIDIKYNMCIGI